MRWIDPNMGKKDVRYYRLPGWSSSLDLMHSLEEELSEDEWQRYSTLIFQGGKVTIKSIIHMTAAQKAAAWLKVKEG